MIEYRRDLESVDWDSLNRELMADNFHNGRTTIQLRMSFENSTHVAMGFDGNRCIANGRLLSDRVGNAYVIDVWTLSAYRRQGIGHQIMQMLVDAVPGQHIYLQTDDAIRFYERLGFARQPEGMSRISGVYLQNASREGGH